MENITGATCTREYEEIREMASEREIGCCIEFGL